MSETSCIETEALVDYLYGESDADARRRVDAHVRSCARCAGEIGSLTAVRGTLGNWEPPGVDPGLRVVAGAGGAPCRASRRLAWALAAAAVLAVAAAALIARPAVELGAGGVVVRFGGGGESGAPDASNGPPDAGERDRPSRARTAPGAPDASNGPPDAGASNGPPAGAGAPERAEAGPPRAPTVRGTPAGLRDGAAARPRAAPGVGPGPGRLIDDAWLQQVREMIRESEQRQIDRVEAAEQRIGEQHQADLTEMERRLREDRTNDAAARQEILEFMRRVSDRR